MAIDTNQISSILHNQQVRKLVGGLMGSMGGSRSGGTLNGLLNQFSEHGLGDHVQSWVGQGANAQISPQQITDALGPQQLDEVAHHAGVSQGTAAQGLASALPQLVNAATPDGKLPGKSDLSEIQELVGAGSSRM
jgi:uncharacterized protein YidB (DUF937 family)